MSTVKTIKKDQAGLLIRAGFAFSKRLIVKAGGTPVDLSGATARLDIKLEATDVDAIFSFSTDPDEEEETVGLLTLNAVPGAIDFLATAEATGAIAMTRPLLKGVHDLRLVLPGQEATCLLSGIAVITKGITL